MLRRPILLASQLLFVSVALAACARDLGPTLGENPEMLGPNLTQEIANGEFFLGYGDTIQVDFWEHTDLNATSAIGADGALTLYMVGDLQVGGMTYGQLKETIRKAYARYLVNPSFTLQVTARPRNKITLLGRVRTPGVYDLERPGTSLLEALALAGGVEETGDAGAIMLARRVGGRVQVVPYSIDLLFDPEHPVRTEIPFVQRGDVIYVLQSKLSEYKETLDATVLALRTLVLAEQSIILAPRVSEAWAEVSSGDTNIIITP